MYFEKCPSVLIIGAGVYVCGRNTEGFGTVLPTLMEAQNKGLIGEILVAGTRAESVKTLQDKLAEINNSMGTHVQVTGYPKNNESNPLAYRQALQELSQPACAIVVAPDHLHSSITADTVRAGVHSLVVKPLAPTLREANDLVEMVEAHKVYGAVEFHKRFDEANLLLRQALANGRLGNVCYITVEYSQRRVVKGIFQSWLHHTNVFQYLGVHYVDLIYFVTGARPVRVLAMGYPNGQSNGDEFTFEAIQALVEWEYPHSSQRFVSTIVTNWIDPDASTAMSDQRITVVGTLGRYQSDQKHRGVQMVTDDGQEDINPYFAQCYVDATGEFSIKGYGPSSIRQFLVDVRNLINGNCQLEDLVLNRPSFRDGLVSTAVVEAVNHSLSREGEWVTIDHPSLCKNEVL